MDCLLGWRKTEWMGNMKKVVVVAALTALVVVVVVVVRMNEID